MKKPYQTVAGWLTFIVVVLGGVLGLGIIPEGSVVSQIIGVIISVGGGGAAAGFVKQSKEDAK